MRAKQPVIVYQTQHARPAPSLCQFRRACRRAAFWLPPASSMARYAPRGKNCYRNV